MESLSLLSLFVSNLYYLVVAFITLCVAILVLSGFGVMTFRVSKILYALLQYSVTEPEQKIVRKVQKLNKKKK